MAAPLEIPRWQRILLPGGMRGADARRSARDWVIDVVMFALAITLGVLSLADTWHAHGDATKVIDVVLGVVTCAGLWVRRSHPLGFAVLAIVLGTVSAAAGGAAVMALFNAAIRVRMRELGWLVVATLVSMAIFTAIYPSEDGTYAGSIAIGVLLTVVAVGWGLYARAQRDLVTTLHERADEAEAHAREAERRRIAREMHDVLAHRMSLLSLHAGALEFRPDAPPEEVAEAAGVIRGSAHAALKELREVIGVLREDGGDGAEPPQPTLAQIPALVEESRAAGMRVDLAVDAPEAVPDSLGRAAYRVVQEGLTNARKHAPDAGVRVAVRAGNGRLEVKVSSRPAVGVAAVPGAGAGLIGLAERVELAGGSLSHGADASGDFVLRAELPWTP
jgi:signal transduction histidine kinase